jgi:hypothetical protein
MASFTDSITQFNPYVSQLPVDAMVKVGMYKQQQYDQGVQRIQSQIDSVAGMDIAKDSDKQYLQSKLNQLGSKLTAVAAGDFSNQQLVSSVAGMATQVGRDEKVQNAVASTAWYKKQKGQLDKDYQAGKSSVANVRDFDRQASKWLNNDEVGERFNGRYSPYIDITKKWNEVIKAVHPMASSEDFAYENFVDNKGKVHTDKLAAAMTRITKEGVTSDQIENAIRASMTPDDLNQIRIDANYRFENVDSDNMKLILMSSYDSKLKDLDKTEKLLNQAITVVSGDPVQLEFAKRSLNDLSKKRLQLKQTLQNDLALSDSNLEAVKTSLYKEGAIDQTAAAFSWENKTKQLLTNPLLQAQFEQDRINLSKATLQETISQHKWDRFMDTENLKLGKEKLVLDRQKALDDKFGVASGFTTLVGEGTKNLLDPVAAINADVYALDKSTLQAKQELGGGNINVANALIETYKKDVRKVEPWQADAIEDILKNEQLSALRKKELTGAEVAVLANDPSLRKRNEEIQSALKTNRPLNITINGKKETFTPKELFDYTTKYNKESSSKLYGAGMEGDASGSVSQAGFSEKEKILNKILSNPTANKEAYVFVKQLTDLYNQLVSKDSKLTYDLNNAKSSYLSTTNGTYIPAVTGIVTDPKSRPFYEAAATSALAKYSFDKIGVKGGSSMLSPDDAVLAQTWLSDEGKSNIQYQKLNYAGKQSLVLTKEGKQIIIPLSADQERQLPKLTGEANSFNEDINRMQISNGNLSTNPTNDVNKSFYQPWSMKTQGLNAYADLHRSPNSADIQYINLNLKNREGEVYPLTINQKLNAISADEFIKGLTNKDIKDLYLSSPNIPDAWKEKIRNL